MRKEVLLSCLLLTGCAGFSRQCSSFSASNFGASWIVVQHKNDGSVSKCWMLDNVAIENEHASDGIYWKAKSGHLVHLSGWYTRVQVEGTNFASAAEEIGVDLSVCGK